MTKIYLSKVIGDGKTLETARKPELNGLAGWILIEDLGDYMIVEAEAIDKQLNDTQEL